jgi:hypothetical protein
MSDKPPSSNTYLSSDSLLAQATGNSTAPTTKLPAHPSESSSSSSTATQKGPPSDNGYVSTGIKVPETFPKPTPPQAIFLTHSTSDRYDGFKLCGLADNTTATMPVHPPPKSAMPAFMIIGNPQSPLTMTFPEQNHSHSSKMSTQAKPVPVEAPFVTALPSPEVTRIVGKYKVHKLVWDFVAGRISRDYPDVFAKVREFDYVDDHFDMPMDFTTKSYQTCKVRKNFNVGKSVAINQYTGHIKTDSFLDGMLLVGHATYVDGVDIHRSIGVRLHDETAADYTSDVLKALGLKKRGCSHCRRWTYTFDINGMAININMDARADMIGKLRYYITVWCNDPHAHPVNPKITVVKMMAACLHLEDESKMNSVTIKQRKHVY